MPWQCGLNHVLDNAIAKITMADLFGVLGRHHDGVDPHGLAISIFDRHLGLPI
jgi:hypothetical protein